MKVQSGCEVDQQPVSMEGAHGCKVRWLVGEPDGAPNFAMREFEIEPGGFTPRHHHPYEHEVFVLAGEGEVWEGDRAHPLSAGDVIYVAPNDVHQFKNTGSAAMRFLCMVPHTSAQPTVAPPECGVEGD